MIYMDYAATSYVKDEVLDEMLPFFKEDFGNPSSIHQTGTKARKAVDLARKRCKIAIGARDEREIIFTSGGSEADNLGIKGVCLANKDRGKHIITSAIEHHAVLNACNSMVELGYELTVLPVDSKGLVSLIDLKNAFRDDTVLVSIMYANNEVGTIQNVKEIGKLCKEAEIFFHCDAVQAMGNVQIDVDNDSIDMLSVSGHKIYGPKGVGLLYVKKGIKLSPLINGGSQEFNKRGGTENVPGIVGLGKAMELCTQNLHVHVKKMTELRDKLIYEIENKVNGAVLNGHRENRLANNVNFSFSGVSGEALLLSLDLKGICVSTGSACSLGSIKPSHVLGAMGFHGDKSAVRFSLGDSNTTNEIDFVAQTVAQTVERLRNVEKI